MSATPGKPVFLLSPGGFCPSTTYDRLVRRLTVLGYAAHAVDHPSIIRRKGEPAGLYDDVEELRSLAEKVADEGWDIVLIGCSYGGLVVTEAPRGLSKVERQAQGKAGGVVHLVFIASLFCPVGMSLNEIAGAHTPVDADSTGAITEPPPQEVAAQRFFSELSPAEQKDYSRRLKPQSSKVFEEKIRYAGYEHIPTTAILPLNDASLSPELARKNTDAVLAKGVGNIKKVTIDADHCAMISHPSEIADILLEALGRK